MWYRYLILLFCLTRMTDSFIVSQIIDKVLDQLIKTESVPLVDFGYDVGRLTNLTLANEGVVKNVKAVGLWGFAIDVDARNISVEGQYEIKNLEIPGLFPVYGKGGFSALLNSFSARFVADIKSGSNGDFVTNITALNVSLDTAMIDFENLFDDPSLSDFINDLASSLLPDMLEIVTNEGRPILQPIFQYLFNEIYSCVVSGDFEKCIEDIFKNPKDEVFEPVMHLLSMASSRLLDDMDEDYYEDMVEDIDEGSVEYIEEFRVEDTEEDIDEGSVEYIDDDY